MPEQQTNPDEAYIDALLRERGGYARGGRAVRVAAVDAELERLGVTRPDTHDDVEQAVASPQERAVPARRNRTRKV